ncbi:MAG: adenosine kinase [Acidimicrobiales bacterium]
MHVVGLGNAIVDVITNVDDSFITEHGLEKGAMTLIDAKRALSLYDLMPAGTEVGGGSAANTMVGIASFGTESSYIGKVSDDVLGQTFRDDLRKAGVAFDMDLASDGPPTARCLIQVTPDAQRTLNTFLGVSAELEPADVDLDLIRRGDLLYCEGYLYDTPPAKAAIELAMTTAAQAGAKVSLTLSDGFCVDRHRQDFLSLVDNNVDILFGNQDEICSLYETDDFEQAAARVGAACELVCLTRGAAGSVIINQGAQLHIEAAAVETVVDTTGAGDLYSAGFLHGHAMGKDLEACGRLASLAAAEVISHIGPRPLVSLADLAAQHGLN